MSGVAYHAGNGETDEKPLAKMQLVTISCQRVRLHICGLQVKRQKLRISELGNNPRHRIWKTMIPLDISLRSIWAFVEPLLSDALKDRLKPKASDEKARERAFSLYQTLGDVQKSTDAFLAAFRNSVNSDNILVGNDLVAEVMAELLDTLERLANDLAAVNPQLAIHQHDLVQTIQYFHKSRMGVIQHVQEVFKCEMATDTNGLQEHLQVAESNAELLQLATGGFRQFLASEFAFKDSF